jgi:hypothetical protein
MLDWKQTRPGGWTGRMRTVAGLGRLLFGTLVSVSTNHAPPAGLPKPSTEVSCEVDMGGRVKDGLPHETDLVMGAFWVMCPVHSLLETPFSARRLPVYLWRRLFVHHQGFD